MYIEIPQFISGLLIDGFILTALVLIIPLAVIKNHFLEKESIAVSCKLLLLGCTIFLVINGVQLLRHLNIEEGYLWKTRLFGKFWFAYAGRWLFKGVVPQVLWWKNLRNKFWISIALIPFLCVDFYMPLIYSYNNDYLPTSWTMFNFSFESTVIGFVTYIAIIILTYYLKSDRSQKVV